MVWGLRRPRRAYLLVEVQWRHGRPPPQEAEEEQTSWTCGRPLAACRRRCRRTTDYCAQQRQHAGERHSPTQVGELGLLLEGRTGAPSLVYGRVRSASVVLRAKEVEKSRCRSPEGERFLSRINHLQGAFSLRGSSTYMQAPFEKNVAV